MILGDLLPLKGIATSKLSKISNFIVKTGIYFTSKES
jgi:hypothetical protein